MKQRIKPLLALNAMRRLLRNPEQTEEVFTIIRALSGRALEKGFERFKTLPMGQRILQERRDLLSTLLDRDALRSLPEHTLGRHYLAFVERENISADGLVAASDKEANLSALPDDLARFGARQRDMHDLWHTLSDYGRDELGEACLLAFTYAQTKNRGVGFICLIGCFKLSQRYGSGVFSAAFRAYRDGRRAAWLPGQDWEAKLAQPIGKGRSELGLRPPERYQRLKYSVLSGAAA